MVWRQCSLIDWPTSLPTVALFCLQVFQSMFVSFIFNKLDCSVERSICVFISFWSCCCRLDLPFCKVFTLLSVQSWALPDLWLMVWLDDWWVDWLIDWLIDWLMVWLMDWLIDRSSINKSTGWLIDWGRGTSSLTWCECFNHLLFFLYVSLGSHWAAKALIKLCNQ